MRNASLDWLRVISILYITAFWHLFNYTRIWPAYHHPVFWRITVLALALFVLISGFLIGSANTPKTRQELWIFSYKRFIRIYPPYVFALALFAILELSGRLTLLKGAFLVGIIFTPPPPTLWFIGMIVIFYALAPIIMYMSEQVSLLKVTIFVGLLVAGLVVIRHYTGLFDPRLPLYLPVFVTGVMLARRPQIQLSAATVFPMFLAAAFSAALSLNAAGIPDQSLWMLPFAMSSSALIFLLFNGRLRRSIAIEKLSYASFFLYLLHRPIYHAFVRFFKIEDGISRVVMLMFFALPIAVLLAYIAQHVYDHLVAVFLKRLRLAPK